MQEFIAGRLGNMHVVYGIYACKHRHTRAFVVHVYREITSNNRLYNNKNNNNR